MAARPRGRRRKPGANQESVLAALSTKPQRLTDVAAAAGLKLTAAASVLRTLIAKKLAAKQNFDVKVVDMADVDPATIAKSKNLIVYISTWGEGDPPQRAVDFHKALLADDAPRFEGVRFAVLALGDTAYVNFCQTGKQIDARLEALGGTRAADRQDLDLDFQKAAAAWTDKALEVFAPAEAAATTVVHVDFKGAPVADEDRADEPERRHLGAGQVLRGQPPHRVQLLRPLVWGQGPGLPDRQEPGAVHVCHAASLDPGAGRVSRMQPRDRRRRHTGQAEAWVSPAARAMPDGRLVA